MESKFNKLYISDKNSSPKYCSYCNKPFTEELWCKECDPFKIMEGWTSENPDIDKFIRDTIYNSASNNYKFLEWVPFDKFTDIKKIGEGGFAKVYSATWTDGKSKYVKQNDGIYKKENFEPEKVALKRLDGSQNMSDKYLNEVRFIFYISTLIYLISFIKFIFI
jgi:hypothetical protein